MTDEEGKEARAVQSDNRRLVEEAIYDLLQADITPGEIVYHPTGVGSGTTEAVLGRSSNNELMLLLPSQDTTLSTRRELRHLKLVEQAHRLNSQSVPCLEMRLVNPGLVSQFEQLLVDVLDLVVEDPDRPDSAVEKAVTRWEELFRAERHRSHEDEIGLMGELLVVERLVELDPQHRSGSWHSDGDLHDLAVVAMSLEVKTTMSPDSMEIHISLLDQLADVPGAQLLLAHVRLEERDDGRTITEVFETLAATVTDRAHLDSTMHKLGWRAGQEERRFTLKDLTLYRVDDNFPRLTPDHVKLPPAGVAVEYTVDLDEATSNRLDDDETATALQSFAEGLLP